MKNNRKHWMRNTRFYRIRYNILWRCNREWPRSDHYKNKWIKCLRSSFDEFKNDMYEKYIDHVNLFWEQKTSINRIDNDWNYCKENCERATSKTQSLNTSRNLMIERDWVIMSAKEWSDHLGINENTIRVRFMRWQDPLLLGKIHKRNSLVEQYNKHREIMGDQSVSYHTFWQRIRRQWKTIKEAIYMSKNLTKKKK